MTEAKIGKARTEDNCWYCHKEIKKGDRIVYFASYGYTAKFCSEECYNKNHYKTEDKKGGN